MSNNCPKCGTVYQKGDNFCQNCGCSLEFVSIENPVCPQCKTQYPTSTKFCINDGAKLVSPEDLLVLAKTPYGETQSFHSFQADREYEKASFGRRFVAALLDGLISLGFSVPAIIFLVLGLEKTFSIYYNHGSGEKFFFIAFLCFLIPLGYNFIKDGLGQGQSWGKRALDIMVVNLDDNTPCSIGKSFFRNFISGLVGVIPYVGWLIEPIMVLANEDGRKLGDRAANTQVINKNSF